MKNFVGNSVVRENLYGLRDPTSGPDAQAALAFLTGDQCVAQVSAVGGDLSQACSANDTALFTAMAMLRNRPIVVVSTVLIVLVRTRPQLP